MVELKEDDPRAWRIWLEILHHGSIEQSSYDASTLTVWHVLLIAEKYGISPTRKDARVWFNTWIDSHEKLFTKQGSITEILFPCYAFDHARGFATGTKWLAYNAVGHVKETRPAGFTQHTHLRLDNGILRSYHPAHAPYLPGLLMADLLQNSSTQPVVVSGPSYTAVFTTRSTGCSSVRIAR